jgi:putative aldouronate transport system substrate-binding protein
MNRKLISFFLAVLLTLGMLSASALAQGAYTDYTNGFQQKVTIQIPVFDRAYEGWNVADNYFTRWVQAEFGDKHNIAVEFVGIARSAQVNDYMQLLAAGSAPNIIFHYDMPQILAYFAEGAMAPIDLEELAYYAPTYWAKMGETIQTYGAVDGVDYFFFADRPDAYNAVYLIRQDWLDAVGMAMPASLEELNAVLTAWKDAGLGNGGGWLIQNSFTFDYPYRDFNMSAQEHALYSDLAIAPLSWEPARLYLKNMNFQYNNGLIDTEFYLNTDDAATKADFVAGNSGIYNTYLTSNSDVISGLVANDPAAKVSYMPFAALSPEGTMPQTRAYWPFGMIMGINQDSTAEERIAVWMYLEWLSQPENLFFMQNGVEGENYTLSEEGLAVRTADFAGESMLSQNNNKDYWCLITESAEYADAELTRKANLTNWAPAGYEYIIEAAHADYLATDAYRKPDALFSVDLPAIAEYKAELTELWKELYVKCVMAPEADFDAVYAQAAQDYLDAGYQLVLDEKQVAIDAGSYN